MFLNPKASNATSSAQANSCQHHKLKWIAAGLLSISIVALIALTLPSGTQKPSARYISISNTEQTGSPGSPPDPDDPWYQRNSIDPDRGPKPDKSTLRETESAWRLRSEKGIQVERMDELQRQTKSGDFIDANGNTYNMVGNNDPRFVLPDKMTVDNIIKATHEHSAHKGLDFVVVDLNGIGSQAQYFMDWYQTLDATTQSHILIVGGL